LSYGRRAMKRSQTLPPRCNGERIALSQRFCGNPRLIPPWLGSSQRLVTTLPRV